MKKPRKKTKRLAKSDKTPGWVKECVPLTVEQFDLCCRVAHAAATGLMPRQSFESKFEEAMESGKVPDGPHLRLTDKPINHAAMAIMDCFPDKSAAGDALRLSALHRTMFVADAVYRDTRAQRYIKTVGKEQYIGSPLVEAIATTP